MTAKWTRTGILVCILLLAACSPINNENGSSTPTTGDVKPEATNSIIESQEPTVSVPSSIPDEREVFAANLNQYGQQFLGAFPEASVYHISLVIPEDLTELLTGTVSVRYFNTEDVSLDEIYFRLFSNYWGGQIEVSNVTVDETPASTSLENSDTSLRVDLDQSLAPGESVQIDMDFQLKLPETMGGNYGLLGYFDDVLVLDTFYPMIPAYDENGWYSEVPMENGDLTYNDASFYLVEVSAPADMVLAASGSVVETDTQDGVQTLTIAAGPARDFFLAGSYDFTVVSQEWEGIQVNSYALTGFQKHQKYVLRDSVEAIKTFSDLFGPYPYSEFDVISSPMLALGIEYPGIVGILWRLYQEGESTQGVPNDALLESVVAHEVGHQWFYNVVGSNQQSEPWVDESLVQYITEQYFVAMYGDSAGDGLKANWYARWERAEKEEIPIGLEADDYESTAYSAIVYGRGPLFYLELENQLGRDTLLKGISDYYLQNQWQLTHTEDVRASLESACGCDLTDMFEEWVYPEN